MPAQPPNPPLPSLAGAQWLARPAAQAVFSALRARGLAARVVGGAVRNALMGMAVTDVDIATPARPEEVIAAAKAAGLGVVPTGLAHGTVTVLADHVPHEVTTLRRDVETDGRRATVAFTDDWEADARRRDFSINALYCAADGEVFDPLGGYADLVQRRVRFIGDARERIREDYLRTFRFFRMTARYGEGRPDDDGLAACVAERAGLVQLSAERVREEMLRLLVAPRAVELVGVMQDYGILAYAVPAAPRPGLLGRLAQIEAELGLAGDTMLRLAALGVEIPEDADRLSGRLRLSNDEHARLTRAAMPAPHLDPDAPEHLARACLYREGEAAFRERVLMAWTRSGDPPTSVAWRGRFTLPGRWQPPRFPLGGADVMSEGVAAGPRVGSILAALEERWIADNFITDATALRAQLQEMTRQER